MSSVGRLTIGSLTAFPSTRMQPMPWSMRALHPWGYFYDNTKIAISPNATIHSHLTPLKPQHFAGQLNTVRNAIKPIVGIIQLTAYDYQHRPSTTYVPQGSKIFVDGVQVATIGTVGYAAFQMHANDPHVIRVEMIDPYWGTPYIGFAETMQTVALDGILQVSLNVPRARFEPWTYNIVATSVYNGISSPVAYSISEDGGPGVLVSSGIGQANPVDNNLHSFTLSLIDSNPHASEKYSVNVVGVYGGNVVAQFQGIPPVFSFSQTQNVINNFSIGPTSGVSSINHPDYALNNEPFSISANVTGNIVSVVYQVTLDSITTIHNASAPDYAISITPNASSTPDNLTIMAVFTDSSNMIGQYEVDIPIHAHHVHHVHVIDDSTNLSTPFSIEGAQIYIDGSFAGLTDTTGIYTIYFGDQANHIIKVEADDPDTNANTKIQDYSVYSVFDSETTKNVMFEWEPAAPPIVFGFVIRDNGQLAPIPVSGAAIAIDGSTTAYTAADGSFRLTLPDNKSHLLSVSADDPLKKSLTPLTWHGNIQFQAGTVNRLPAIMLSYIEDATEVTPKKKVTVNYGALQPAILEPVLGPEKDTYLRMIYGTMSNLFGGVTAGKFYDMRALPLPYQRFDRTWFQLDFVDEILDGTVVEVQTTREAPLDENVSNNISVVLTYPTTLFSVRLGKGANSIKVVAPNGFELATKSVVTTRYATQVHAMAVEIYTNAWQKLETIGSTIFGRDPTALTAPLIGFDDELPHPPNLNQIARRFIVNAFMNMPGSTQGISTLFQALFGFTPIFSKHLRYWIGDSWVDGSSSMPDQLSGQEIGIWSPNDLSARWTNFSRLMTNTGVKVSTPDTNVIADGQEHDFSELKNPITRSYEDGSEWIELLEQNEVSVFDFWPYNRSHGFVQYPGLYDFNRSYDDVGAIFDYEHAFELSDKSLDPKMTGLIGLAITPGPLYHNEDSPPMGIFSIASSDFGFAMETYMISGTDVTV